MVGGDDHQLTDKCGSAAEDINSEAFQRRATELKTPLLKHEFIVKKFDFGLKFLIYIMLKNEDNHQESVCVSLLLSNQQAFLKVFLSIAKFEAFLFWNDSQVRDTVSGK